MKVTPLNVCILEYTIDNCDISVWAILDPECKSANLLYMNQDERMVKTERLWIEHREEMLDQMVEDRLKRYFGKFKTSDSN